MKNTATCTKKITTSPWGPVQWQGWIADGIVEVSTPMHGGMLVEERVARTLLSAKALAIADRWHGYFAFEEDDEASVFIYEQPALYTAYLRRDRKTARDPDQLKEAAARVLRRAFPTYFAG